jgi:hypothetical protein
VTITEAAGAERSGQAKERSKVMNAHVLASWQAPDATIPRDFIILCLWSRFGIALSGLFFLAGLGTDIMEALAVAG